MVVYGETALGNFGIKVERTVSHDGGARFNASDLYFSGELFQSPDIDLPILARSFLYEYHPFTGAVTIQCPFRNQQAGFTLIRFYGHFNKFTRVR